VPEALIASMLDPEEFGVYYAVGTEKKSRGQAIFFEIDPNYRNEFFEIDAGIKRCVPHEDGSPKASIYISVYRVLEHISMDAIQTLFLTTQDGRTLAFKPGSEIPTPDTKLHLYQEIAPVTPLVCSILDPVKFYELIVCNPDSLLTLPAICFVDLSLGELAKDPLRGAVGDLPYDNIDHLREVLAGMKNKNTKMVDRTHSATLAYRTIKTGIYVGNKEKLLFFRMPTQEELKANHYNWWRSARM